MPDTWADCEGSRNAKYHIVTIHILPCNRSWAMNISPSIAVICQYLSSLYGIWRLPFFSSLKKEPNH